jgi:hypothetical protein
MNGLSRIVVVIGLALVSAPAVAETPSKLRSDQIRVSYVKPKNADYEPILRLTKERRLLERFREFLSPLRLPRVLTLKLAGCDGVSNAWYEEDTITICYEYLADIERNAPKQTTPAGITRLDAIIGPVVEVVLHETGHAVIDYLKIPVLGREEDAADQLAAFMLLQFGGDDARRLIGGVAYTYFVDAQQPSTKENPLADEHGLPMQRFYNLLCMAYGADPKLFADLVEKKYLPKGRAEGCEDEYQQVSFAMDKLIRPYVDRKLAKQVRAKRWVNFENNDLLKSLR